MHKFIFIALTICLLSFGSHKIYGLYTDSVTFTTDLNISTGEVLFEIEALENKPINESFLTPGNWNDYGSATIINSANGIPIKAYMYVKNLQGKACGDVILELSTNKDDQKFVLFTNEIEKLNGKNDKTELTFEDTPILSPGESMTVYQRVKLKDDTKPNIQGKTCSWDEVFLGESFTE